MRRPGRRPESLSELVPNPPANGTVPLPPGMGLMARTLERLGLAGALVAGDVDAANDARAKLEADADRQAIEEHVRVFGYWQPGDPLGVPPLGPSETPGYQRFVEQYFRDPWALYTAANRRPFNDLRQAPALTDAIAGTPPEYQPMPPTTTVLVPKASDAVHENAGDPPAFLLGLLDGGRPRE